MAATTAGNEVVLKDGRGRLLRISLKELLFSDRAAYSRRRGTSADDDDEMPRWSWGGWPREARRESERAEHVGRS